MCTVPATYALGTGTFEIVAKDVEVVGNDIGIWVAGTSTGLVERTEATLSRYAGIIASSTIKEKSDSTFDVGPTRKLTIRNSKTHHNGTGIVTDQWTLRTIISGSIAQPADPADPSVVLSHHHSNVTAAIFLGGAGERVTNSLIDGPLPGLVAVPEGPSADALILGHVPTFADVIPAGLATARMSEVDNNRIQKSPRGLTLWGAFNSEIHHNLLINNGAGVVLASVVAPVIVPVPVTAPLSTWTSWAPPTVDFLARTIPPVENNIHHNTIRRACTIGGQATTCTALVELARTICRDGACAKTCQADGGLCVQACVDAQGIGCTCGDAGCTETWDCDGHACTCAGSWCTCDVPFAAPCWNGLAVPKRHRVEGGDNPFHRNDIQSPCADPSWSDFAAGTDPTCTSDQRPIPLGTEPATAVLSVTSALIRPKAPQPVVSACGLSLDLGTGSGGSVGPFPAALPGQTWLWDTCNSFHGFDGAPEYPSRWLFDTRDHMPGWTVDETLSTASANELFRAGNTWHHLAHEPGG